LGNIALAGLDAQSYMLASGVSALAGRCRGGRPGLGWGCRWWRRAWQDAPRLAMWSGRYSRYGESSKWILRLDYETAGW